MDLRLSRAAAGLLATGLAAGTLVTFLIGGTDSATVPTAPAPAPTTDPVGRADTPPTTAAPPRTAATIEPLPDAAPPECPEPYASLGVVRSGRDDLGRPTWWHPDGSKTVLVTQTIRRGGVAWRVPAAIHATPRDVHRAAESTKKTR